MKKHELEYMLASLTESGHLNRATVQRHIDAGDVKTLTAMACEAWKVRQAENLKEIICEMIGQDLEWVEILKRNPELADWWEREGGFRYRYVDRKMLEIAKNTHEITKILKNNGER